MSLSDIIRITLVAALLLTFGASWGKIPVWIPLFFAVVAMLLSVLR